MIVVDIEISGANLCNYGIWQIGAIDLETGEEFLKELKIDEGDFLSEDSLSPKTLFETIGKTEENLRDKNKQSQKQMLKKFLDWVKERKTNNFLCQYSQFDLDFILTKARKCGPKIPFHFSALDLHSLVQFKHFEVRGSFRINLEKNRLDFGLKNILIFCGINYDRGNHQAVEDCLLEGEYFYRLVYGKNVFSEFKKFEIPEYLRK